MGVVQYRNGLELVEVSASNPLHVQDSQLQADTSQTAENTSSILTKLSGSTMSIGGIIDAALTVAFTRPSDTNVYAANDVITNATSSAVNRSISNVARSNGASGYLRVLVMCSNTSVTPRLRIHIYDAAPNTAKNDNAAWAFDRTNDASKYLGYVDLDAMNSGVAKSSELFMYKCASASRDLFFEVQTLDSFTPASATGYTIKIIPDQNNV